MLRLSKIVKFKYDSICKIDNLWFTCAKEKPTPLSVPLIQGKADQLNSLLN